MARSIGATSLLLTLVAAFTDSATFVGADKLFSAHVTGNFIVLAYDIIHGADVNEWSKLLAFPVFVAAVMLAGRIANRRTGVVVGEGPVDAAISRGGVLAGGAAVGLDAGGRLLRIEGILLVLAGLAAVVMRWGAFGGGMVIGADLDDHRGGDGFSECFWPLI